MRYQSRQICNCGSNAHSRLHVSHTCCPELIQPKTHLPPCAFVLRRWNWLYDSKFRSNCQSYQKIGCVSLLLINLKIQDLATNVDKNVGLPNENDISNQLRCGILESCPAVSCKIIYHLLSFRGSRTFGCFQILTFSLETSGRKIINTRIIDVITMCGKKVHDFNRPLGWGAKRQFFGA